jgi:multisubunit Na+/H+ antiporter MnhC subunit
VRRLKSLYRTVTSPFDYPAVIYGTGIWFYYAIYTRPSSGTSYGPWIFVGIALLALILQIRNLTRNPSLRTSLLQLIFGVSFINYAFALTYYTAGTSQNFGKPLTHIDALYFELTTFTTVGYGDIAARSQLARGLVSIQLAVDIVFVLGIVTIVLARLTQAWPLNAASRQHPPARPDQ